MWLLACTADESAPPPDTRGYTHGDEPPRIDVAVVDAGDLVCTTAISDPEGDAVTVSMTWTVDGAAWGTGERVPLEETARGRVWACTGVADDGASTAEATDDIELSGPVPGEYAFEVAAEVPFAGDVVALPDGTLLVATLLSEVVHVDPASGATLGSAEVSYADDLIALALDPQFGDGLHDWIYTWTNRSCLLQRWPLTLEPFAVGEGETLVAIDCPSDSSGHSGGDLLWWAGETEEPVLYLALGPTIDSDPRDGAEWGQHLLAFAIDADTGAVGPAVDGGFDNPYVAAIGLRNPWRLADCGAVICLADPGSSDFEEVDLYAAAGANFGFPIFEGPGDGSFEEPVAYWQNDETTFTDADLDGSGRMGFVNSPWVGVRASGRGYGGRLEGWALYGEIYDGWVRAIEVASDGSAGGDVAIAHLPYILAMTEAPDGTIYAADMSGAIQRLILRADRPTVAAAGTALSSVAPGGIAYDVLYPLWSDGAEKDRALELPDGQRVTLGETWSFPDGTRVWKTFSVAGAPVETRVLERRDGAWIPGVYIWDGEEAWLSDGRRTSVIAADGSTYDVPSTQVCVECHDALRGREWPLGLEPVQLGDAGLTALAEVLDGDPGPAPVIEGDAPEVRGYLHANCSFCHQPGAVANTVSVTRFDLRHDAEDMGLVGEVAQYWHANPNVNDGGELIVPGSPKESTLVEILEVPDMPTLLVSEPDVSAIANIWAWIEGM